MPALRCFSVLCYQNPQVSMAVATGGYNKIIVCDWVKRMIAVKIVDRRRMKYVRE